MTRRFVTFSLAVILIVAAAVAFARPALVLPQAASLAETVNALTTPEMDGRRSGTPGGDHAAARLADWLAAAGLRPGGDAGSYLQSFVLETSSRPDPASSLELSGPSARRLEFGRDWIAHGGSLAGEVSGEVVFVGYGATAAEAGSDDYTGIDVRGKIALALDGSPPRLANARVGRLDKLIAAKARGAAALLIVNGDLPAPDTTSVEVGLLSGAVTREAADAMLAPSGRMTAEAARTLTGEAPARLATPSRVRIRVEKVTHEIRAANVIGILPGTDPTVASEAVVVGAHYDHLGRADGVVYPGADDNGSGTALVLGLARAFAAAGGADRTLVFAFFGAEELGLIGSRHYVQQPPIALARTVGMVNFDMVGRLQGRPLSIGGSDSGGSQLRTVASDAAQADGVAFEVNGSPYGPSDHSRFYAAGVPVLFLYTGSHSDYHRPTDTADKIDAAGMARVAAVGARVVGRLASESRPVFAQVARPNRRHGVGAAGGALLGVVAVPRSGDGIRLSSVMPGTAAESAGLHEGDVIVRFAGLSVDGLEDLRTLIRDRHPGDTVSILYLRAGEAHTTSATLGLSTD